MIARKSFILHLVLLFLLGSFLSLAGNEALWKKAKVLSPGIRLLQFERILPFHEKTYTVKIAVVRVDLTRKGLSFTGTARDKDWGKPMPDYEPKPPRTHRMIRTRRVTTPDFMKNYRMTRRADGTRRKMVLAVNSTPWLPWEPPFTFCYAEPIGLNISDGVMITESERMDGAVFVVWKNGRADIVPGVPRELWPEVSLAHSGFQIILKDSKVVFEGIRLDPRMIWGLSSDRNYLFLMAVDGRQPGWSDGAREGDMARIMLELGASDAVNMDGGGSTTLCYWNENSGSPVVVNHACSHPHIYCRTTGLNMGICFDVPELPLGENP